MKRSLLVIILSVYTIVCFSQQKQSDIWYNETYRPQYHFTPAENRMGSPISIVRTDSTWHLFYQWNPQNLQDGYVNWGYATSYDLLKWKNQDICLSQPEGIADSMQQTPWWGSVVVKDGKFIAWANSWGEGIFRYSAFNNGKWENREKLTGVDDLTKSDPQVFWHSKTNKWVMFAFNHNDSTISILNSIDGLSWNKITKFNFHYGFASVTEIPVSNKPGESRWMFITNSAKYIIGNFDGEKFEVLSTLQNFDLGEYIGGSIIFQDPLTKRTLLVSEINGTQQPDLPSNGQLSFPTELTLNATDNGYELIRLPAAEIKKLYKKTNTWDNKRIYPGINNNLLQGIKGDCFSIKASIDISNSDYLGIMVRSNRDNIGTDINYNVSKQEFTALDSRFDLKLNNKKLNLEILVDRSSVEIFIDGGKQVVSASFVPDPKSMRYFLYTNGGEINVDHLEVQELKSAWKEK